MRKEISERQFGKLPPRIIEKIGVGSDGTGSTRLNELIIFAAGIGAEIGIRITGKRAAVSDCPDELRQVLKVFWENMGMGSVDGDIFDIE